MNGSRNDPRNRTIFSLVTASTVLVRAAYTPGNAKCQHMQIPSYMIWTLYALSARGCGTVPRRSL